MRLLLRATRRELLRHAGQSTLAVLGIALGVAVVVAVALANESARRAFGLAMEEVTGAATHQVVAGPQGFPEQIYLQLRRAGLRDAAPVVEGYLTVAGEPLQLIGIDPFAETGVRRHTAQLGGETLRQLLLEPGAVVMAATTAERLALAPGDHFSATAAGVEQRLLLAGLIELEGRSAPGLEGLVFADIATAQELLQREGRLDRLDLVAPSAETLAAIAAQLPAGVGIQPAAAHAEENLALTRAFQTNLTAMSLLALVIGAFLIYNTATFSVLRRRALIGSLRLVGVSRRQIFVLVLGEAAILGALGALLGLGAGHLLGRLLVGLVTRTINDLYFVLTVTEFLPAPAPYLWGALLGVGVSVLAALPPAMEAARISPLEVRRRSSVELASRQRAGQRLALGLVALLVGWGLLALPGLVAGFGALFLILLGGALFAPLLLVGVGRIAVVPLGRGFGTIGRQAARGIAGGHSRSAVAVAALAVAISATVGVGVMVESFRSSVDAWLGERLQADLYLAAPGGLSASQSAPLLPEVVARAQALPEVTAMSFGRRVTVASSSGPVQLLALEPHPQRRPGFPLLAGDPERAWAAFNEGSGLLISEPLAQQGGLAVGDDLHLGRFAEGVTLPVVGIFREYGSNQGVVLLRLAHYRRLWGDEALSSTGLYLRPGADPAAVEQRLRAALADLPQRPFIRSTAAIRHTSMEVFDRTFLITRVLRLLAIVVAFVGVLSALMALALERAREHAVLRATGLTPAGLFGLVGLQTGLLGATAGVLALPLGLVMALILIEVINRRAFGWGMTLTLPWEVLGQALLLAVVAALLAGLWPAWRIARTPPALALREE